jgi:hypothetical protein
MKLELLFDLFNRARSEEMGLVIETNNTHQLTMKLHEARKAHPSYAEIEITVPSTPNTVILVKKSVELNEDPWANAGDLPDVQ